MHARHPTSPLLFRALTTVAGRMPDRLVPVVAGALAPFHFLGFPERRRALLANLEIATGAPAAARAGLALRVCAAYNAYLLEFLRLAHLAPDDVCARTTVRGEEHWR